MLPFFKKKNKKLYLPCKVSVVHLSYFIVLGFEVFVAAYFSLFLKFHTVTPSSLDSCKSNFYYFFTRFRIERFFSFIF